jgi:hypothetical protein
MTAPDLSPSDDRISGFSLLDEARIAGGVAISSSKQVDAEASLARFPASRWNRQFGVTRRALPFHH